MKVELYSDEGCAIDEDDYVRLHVWTPWLIAHRNLARRFDVDEIALSGTALRDRRTLKFLLDFPKLRGLSISLFPPVDISPLKRLPLLEQLRIKFGLSWRVCDRFAPVDLSQLTRLRSASISICDPITSILKCESLERLDVTNRNDGRLRELDLSALAKLKSLTLDHCPKLRHVILHPSAKVRDLEVSLCGGYRVDWARIGPYLKRLRLGGRISFPLEDILGAPNLEELEIVEVRKLPPLSFLRRMSKLRKVILFAAPPGPNVSVADRSLLEKINGRRKARRPKM